MSASAQTVAGTQVAGATNVNGASAPINGAVATLADDVASLNAARQNALTIPRSKGTDEGFWGVIAGGKTTDGGF